MHQDLTPIEAQAVEILLTGDSPRLALLREQFRHIKATTVVRSGVGQTREFQLQKNVLPLPGGDSFQISHVDAEVNEGAAILSFILYVRNGLLDALESVSLLGDWPAQIDQFRLYVTRVVS
jgi:hypothetical protein